jgi:tetratricopeptide (TPR) repeat protein
MQRFSSVVILAFVLAVGCCSTATSAQSLPQNSTSNQKAITDPAEYKAYLPALHSQNPFTVAAFVTRYPQSSAIGEIIAHLIAPYLEPAKKVSGYSSADAKLLELAKRLRELAPDDVRALAMITTLDRKRVSIGIREEVNEMCADSQSGLRQLRGWKATDKMTSAEFRKLSSNIADTFNGAAGFCALQRKDYTAARTFYEKAFQLNPTKLEDIYQLTVTDLEMKPMDPKGFWYCGRLIQLVNPAHKKEANVVAKYCQARYRQYHGAGDGWEQIVERSAAEKMVPENFALNANNHSAAH